MAQALSLYSADFAPWYHLLDPVADHAAEASSYVAGFRDVLPEGSTLLELGAGAGNNATFLKRHYRCTLTDLSSSMSDLSRAQNPECEHLLGDMRTLRLGRTFDAVFIHDAICYLTTEADLFAAIETAYVHLRAGGVALFAPDLVRDTFAENTDFLETDDGPRALRGIEWVWDPDPTDDTYVAEYSLLLRDGPTMRTLHDRHVEGLFSIATWEKLFARAGFVSETIPRLLDEDGTSDRMFRCRRPD